MLGAKMCWHFIGLCIGKCPYAEVSFSSECDYNILTYTVYTYILWLILLSSSGHDLWGGMVRVSCCDQCGPRCHDGRLSSNTGVNDAGPVASPGTERHEHNSNDNYNDTEEDKYRHSGTNCDGKIYCKTEN